MKIVIKEILSIISLGIFKALTSLYINLSPMILYVCLYVGTSHFYKMNIIIIVIITVHVAHLFYTCLHYVRMLEFDQHIEFTG